MRNQSRRLPTHNLDINPIRSLHKTSVIHSFIFEKKSKKPPTHLRNPPLHQQHLKAQDRRPLLRRTTLHTPLLDINPVAEVVIYDKDGFGVSVEIGGDIELELDRGEVRFEGSTGGDFAFGASGGILVI